jgi:hypothetical protein
MGNIARKRGKTKIKTDVKRQEAVRISRVIILIDIEFWMIYT